MGAYLDGEWQQQGLYNSEDERRKERSEIYIKDSRRPQRSRIDGSGKKRASGKHDPQVGGISWYFAVIGETVGLHLEAFLGRRDLPSKLWAKIS
jgi:hypothetical protein